MVRGEPMDRNKARAIISRIGSGERPLWRSLHFTKRLKERKYKMPDVYHLIRRGTMQGDPEQDKNRSNYKVQLVGASPDGRRTRLVVGLREKGMCSLITIIDLTPKKKAKKK